MLNFLSPRPNQTPPKSRYAKFFLLVIFFVIVALAVVFGAREYAATRWVGFAEQIGKKIMAINWDASPRPPQSLVTPKPPRPVPRVGITQLNPLNFTARHIMARDNATGEILFGKAAYEPWPIASITKLFSALVLLDTPLNFSATTTAVIDAVYDNEIVAGQVYTVKDLWGAALVASSNRAILSLVDATGLSRADFVTRMNQKATQLGLTNTRLIEPTGLDVKNTATAADVALLISEALKKPMIQDSLVLTEYQIATVDGRFVKNLKTTDWLISNIISARGLRIRGGKTGSIPEADYNFAVQVASSTDNLVDIVVLGAQSNDARFVEARAVADWVYRSYDWK